VDEEMKAKRSLGCEGTNGKKVALGKVFTLLFLSKLFGPHEVQSSIGSCTVL
jgi:hypothetical protein